MNAPQRFQDKEYKNWVRCSLALNVMKEGLHHYVDTGVKKLHLHIKQNLTTPGDPSVGKTCGICTWKGIRKAGFNPITWNINCRSSVCDKWLSQILAVHYEPGHPCISWKNADISRWPIDPYEIAKVYMPKGQDRTHNNLPQELDAPAVLSLLKFCTLFRTRIPNVRLLSDLIDFRNEVLHSGELKVLDSNKDIWIDKMIELLCDLNLNGSTQSELNRIKCEDIDISFRENEIQALQNLVSGLGGKLAEVTGEMVSLQNVQFQHSEETTMHAEEVNKSLQEREMSKTEKDHRDLYRETPVRYLGYANEVGESFRSQVHVNVVRFSYVVASGYVIADAVSKGIEASVRPCPNEDVRKTNIRRTVFDTLIWQGLATVAIPGFTINRICAFSLFILRRVSSIPEPAKKWTTTAVGLGCIPFIIKPIDRSVDYFMEQTYRKWYHQDAVMQDVVHDTSDD